MADFPSTVNPPGGMSYAAPMVNFGLLGNLGNDYYEGAENQRKYELARVFQGGVPMDPQGNPDYRAITAALAQKGGYGAIGQLADAAAAQQGVPLSPLFGGGVPQGQPGQAPQQAPQQGAPPMRGGGLPEGAPPASAALARPTSADATPATHPGGDAGTGTIVALITDRLPQNSAATGKVIADISKKLGIDPNAPMTLGQQRRAAGLLKNYALPGADTTSAPSPAVRVAGGFSGLESAALQPVAGAAPAAGGAPAAPAPAHAPAAPLVPQPMLPINPATGKPFTDPRQAIAAIEQEEARLSSMPNAQRFAQQIKILENKRQEIADAIKPITVDQNKTMVDPATGRVLYQGPGAAALAGGAAGGETLDADAARYRNTGTLPPNMGRGIQGQAEARAIRARAAQQEIEAGGDPSEWSTRWQDYRATGVGKSAGARTTATRETNLALILRAADAAIPAALEQSAKVERYAGSFVPLNKIIQQGQLATSDPELKAFGMANLQLAEHWARAMNPLGVMRESDRDLALHFLSTADSQATYKRAVEQLRTQIDREYKAIKEGKDVGGPARTPEPAVSAASAVASEGWIERPGGIRIREIK